MNTSLYNEHIKLGAKLVDFAGFSMPVNYVGGIKNEYTAVRNNVGIFDVSHMGQIRILGKDAKSFLDYITTNDVSKLNSGDAQYNLICNLDGGIKDDIILYMLNDFEFLLIVNASNCKKIYDWILEYNDRKLQILNETSEYSLIAVQGPNSRKMLSEIFSQNIDLKFYKHKVFSNNIIVSRTGYTGELGFEILGDHKQIIDIWNKLIQNGVAPCGLAVRDILRMEMKYCLYGNDINENTNPFEAGLKWVVNMRKNDFIGKSALEKNNTINKKLVCFKMIEKCIPRKGYVIFNMYNHKIGVVTSGTFSIGLNYGIGLGYVNKEFDENEICLELRGKKFKGFIIKPPFLDNYSLHN